MAGTVPLEMEPSLEDHAAVGPVADKLAEIRQSIIKKKGTNKKVLNLKIGLCGTDSPKANGEGKLL